LPIDISYSLNYFEPQLDVRAIGVEVMLENREEPLRTGMEVRRTVNQLIDMRHPTKPSIDRAV